MHFEFSQLNKIGLSQNLSDTFGLMSTNGLLDSLGWALIHSVWQGCLAAAIVIVFRGLFKNAAPALRYSVQITALFGLFIAFLSTVLIYQADIVTSNLNTTKLAFTIPFPSQLSLPTIEEATLPTPTSHSASDFQIISEMGQMTPIISLIWVIGFLYLFTRYSAAFLLTRSLRKNGLSIAPDSWNRRFKILLANTGVSSKVELFISDHVQSPMTLGFFKPIVLVPGTFFTGLPSAQIEAILLHEIAHIRRYDYLINLMQLMIKTVFFFHPAVHYICRQIDEDREQACDDISVAQTHNPKALARGLASLRLMQNHAHSNVSSNISVPKMVMNATGPQDSVQNSALINRLKRLIGEDPSARKPEHLLLSAITALLIGGIGLSVAPLQAKASERSQNTRSTPSEVWSIEVADPSEPVESSAIKLAQHDPIEIPHPPEPPLPAIVPSAPQAPLPPLPPEVPDAPLPAEVPAAPFSDLNSDELAGAPITPPVWSDKPYSKLDEAALKAEIEREIHEAERLAHAQMNPQIKAQVERQIEQAKRQIKQAERQIKMAERIRKRAERLAKEHAKKSQLTALEMKRYEAKTERARSKELHKAQQKLHKKQHHKYEALQTTLTQSLISDGLIKSKNDPYIVSFLNGRAVVNSRPVSDNLIDKYCEIFNQYGLDKNTNLKIKSRRETFSIYSQSLDGKSVQNISLGTFKHSDKTNSARTLTKTQTKTTSQTHSHTHHIDHKKEAYGFIKPVSATRTMSEFGKKDTSAAFHTGIDLAAPLKTPVIVSAKGVVQYVTTEPGWGNRIIVNHDNGYQTVYAHLNDTYVSRGQTVQKGMKIGTVGKTGDTKKPHLHFEIIKDGSVLDPKRIIMGF